MIQPLVVNYRSITLMTFFFLFAILINLPVGITQFVEVDWMQLSFDSIWKLAFVVIATTVFTYLFNIYALKQLSPSTIGAFIYLQPLIAAGFAMFVGADQLSTLRIGAALLIFLGVFLSTRTSKYV